MFNRCAIVTKGLAKKGGWDEAMITRQNLDQMFGNFSVPMLFRCRWNMIVNFSQLFAPKLGCSAIISIALMKKSIEVNLLLLQILGRRRRRHPDAMTHGRAINTCWSLALFFLYTSVSDWRPYLFVIIHALSGLEQISWCKVFSFGIDIFCILHHG